MLFWGESVDLTAPVSQLATGYLLIDFKRNIIYHMTWLSADCIRVIYEILRAESLDCE